MTTLVSDPIRYLATQWEDNCGYASAVLSGIAPDAAHLDNGGYHCSIEDLIRFGNGSDYSNTRPDDKGFNPKYGAAIDMSMSTSDMVKCHGRVRAVWLDRTDPRRKYINCINTWDGSGDAVRIDFYANTEKFATADHKWHNHQETRRRYLLDMNAASAIISVLKGETKAQWEGSGMTTPGEIWGYDIDPTSGSYTAGGAQYVTMNRVGTIMNDLLPKVLKSLEELTAKVAELEALLSGGATPPAIEAAIDYAAVQSASKAGTKEALREGTGV